MRQGNEPASHADPNGRPDGVTTRLLRSWGEALADTGRAAPAIVARAMGVSLRPGWLGYAEAADPPRGIGLLVLGLDDGQVQWVSVQLDGERPITGAEIEATFGAGEDVPVLHPDSPGRRSYPAIAGARSACLPLVDVRHGLVVEVTYRIDPPRKPRTTPR